MKVRDIMTKEVKCCEFDTNLAVASEFMWNNDCGVLPICENGRLAGILTDRDICIALGTRNKAASEVTVREVAAQDVQTCSPDADVHTAMAIMRKAKVRRLPVVDDTGTIEGILALNDIIDAVNRKHGDLDYEEVMNTIKAVSEHRTRKHPAAHAVANPVALPIAPVARPLVAA